MLRRSLAFLALLPLAARAQAPLRVVASFSILGDLAREVGGERIALTMLAGPDVDAHHFQPRPSHAEALRGAAVAIRNGWGFDPWFERLLRSTNFRGVQVTATEGITPLEARPTPGHNHGPADPHAWQDVRHAARYARTIAAGLARADAAGAATYQAAAAAFSTRLDALDAWVRAQVATVPEARRVVVTSHDAFAYFSAAYGVRFLAPQGVAKQAEPSAQQVAQLIRQIRGQGITAVFLENMTNPATLERLAAEAGVRIRGRLFADALSAPDGPAPTYEAMMRHNVGLMVTAMRG
ncbi:MAG: zinc ABC transporter substrate-binding protein [Acetobacteraceae bacterium]|nr:zinc ABC transporter substrate-binding protein [Acetobacteraceae bacterium]